jgi:hypothetical protein
MHTAPTKPVIAAANAIESIGLEMQRIVQPAARKRRQGSAFAAPIAAAIIGRRGSPNVIRSAAPDIVRSNARLLRHLGGDALDAGTTIRVSLRSTILTAPKNSAHPIDFIQLRSASISGRGKWGIFKCCAPTVTALRLGKIASADIASQEALL